MWKKFVWVIFLRRAEQTTSMMNSDVEGSLWSSINILRKLMEGFVIVTTWNSDLSILTHYIWCVYSAKLYMYMENVVTNSPSIWSPAFCAVTQYQNGLSDEFANIFFWLSQYLICANHLAGNKKKNNYSYTKRKPNPTGKGGRDVKFVREGGWLSCKVCEWWWVERKVCKGGRVGGM